MSPGSSGGSSWIAVLLAAYQGGPCLEAQLDSILAQTVPNIRIIILTTDLMTVTRQVHGAVQKILSQADPSQAPGKRREIS